MAIVKLRISVIKHFNFKTCMSVRCLIRKLFGKVVHPDLLFFIYFFITAQRTALTVITILKMFTLLAN